MDVTHDPSISWYLPLSSVLLALVHVNVVIAACVWLVRPRTTKRQRLVAVGLGALCSLAVVLSQTSSLMLDSASHLVLRTVGIFLLISFPISAWAVSLFQLVLKRSARSGVYLAVSGLVLLALFVGRYYVGSGSHEDGEASTQQQPGAGAHERLGRAEVARG